MTISSPSPKLLELPEPEINLIATSPLSPQHFSTSNQLIFISSSDDVGSLVFASFPLPSNNSISLVHYLDSQHPGVQIYIDPNSSDPSSILSETISFLNLSPNDLDWVHPHINLATK